MHKVYVYIFNQSKYDIFTMLISVLIMYMYLTIKNKSPFILIKYNYYLSQYNYGIYLKQLFVTVRNT